MAKKKRRLSAKTANRHALYEQAVQCPEADVDFVEKVFKKRNRRKPRLLREDFCGTAVTAAEFVKRHADNRALGVDLDAETLAWGRERHLEPLGERAAHVTLIHDNVLAVNEPRVEVVLAMNFSYFIFKTRPELAAYFAAVRNALLPGGLFVLDIYGGTEAQQTLKEKKKKDGFTYVWDQHEFNPITNEAVNYIHFHFPDGSKMKKAFSYDWRLWTAREVTDLLAEAGFARTDVYWEGWDEKREEGDGVFKKRTRAENCEGWIAYIVAET